MTRVLLLILVSGLWPLVSAAAPARPNILLILADDLGWRDLGCYGNPWFKTPHLDRLAAESIRFTHGYSPAPICSASRAAILTGKTPARLGFEFVTKDKPGGQTLDQPLSTPPFTLNLPLGEITIAEFLRDKGYQTAFFGKWHLNQHHKRYLGWSPTHGPKAQGFSIATEGFGSHPYSYWNKKDQRSFLDLPEGKLPEDAVTRHAIDFLRSDHQQPFFLMVSHFYVHTPIHTRLRWLHDQVLESIPADHPRRRDLAHYGAMVATLDHHVGQLLTALDAAGLSDSTLVVFTSDNGGHPNYAGNAPLRGSKWNLYEGGIRVPFIIRQPGKAHAGTVCDSPVHGIDLFPTFVELAGSYLHDAPEGRSLKPLLKDPARKPPARDMFWHFPYYHPEKKFAQCPGKIGIDDAVTSQTRPHSAVRSGSHKLLHFYQDDRYELYDLAGDPSEQHDLTKDNYVKTLTLQTQLEYHLESVKARMPVPNPASTPAP